MRADRFTPKNKQLTYYSDFSTNFDLNPVTGLLAVVTNEESVKQRLRNLILTNLTDRPYQPTVGSKIKASLFEPIDVVTENTIADSIRTTVYNCEPAVILKHVSVLGNADLNFYEVSVYFETINIPGNVHELNLILKRIH